MYVQEPKDDVNVNLWPSFELQILVSTVTLELQTTNDTVAYYTSIGQAP